MISREDESSVTQLVEHLFRHESGKLVSVLTRLFGSSNMELAEDVVQDSLIEAIKQWTYSGIPANPKAWIFTVAKNKALNIVNREKHKIKYASDVTHFLQSAWTAEPSLNHLFSDEEILDDQLRMMFTCCHPSISANSQVALTLKTLCGFSIPEIARAFLTTDETINKRLVRARQKIREEKIPFVVPEGKDLQNKLETVLETIYLMFNEGYNASHGEKLIKTELCEEAIRLAEIISSHSLFANKSDVHAILALMYLNASRFDSRQGEDGSIITMEDQNRSKWNPALMQKGFSYLELSISTRPKELTVYHILATISAYHCSAPDFGSTNWKSILNLYDNWVSIDSSPLVLLNRTIALSKVEGVEKALIELDEISKIPSVQTYHLLYSTQAEMNMQLQNYTRAIECLQKALQLSTLSAEKELLTKKMDYCRKKIV